MHVLIDQQFREIVEARLKDKGWSRSELARRMGISQPVVAKYLNGHTIPGPEFMEKMLSTLGVRPKLIAEEISEPVA